MYEQNAEEAWRLANQAWPTGGHAGAELIGGADADLATLGAINPQRMADRLVPGAWMSPRPGSE